MAKRPLFIPSERKEKLVEEIDLEFKWYPGYSITQKRKSIDSLHQAALLKGYSNILEISTKSDEILGRELSAFNLKLKFKNGLTATIEQIFQGSKVFEKGGPYTDLYSVEGHKVKKDSRLIESGQLKKFDLMGMEWELEPKTAFYDWLYIHAVEQNSSVKHEILNFDGFTDIAFNPKRSINCQARSAALYVSLHRKKLLDRALMGKVEYQKVILDRDFDSKRGLGAESKKKSNDVNKQLSLFAE